MHYDNLRAILKKNGASLTKPRKIVFDLLLDQDPQSMQVLIKRSEDRLDRATIYRTIELFEELGIVRRLNIGWKYKVELSDLFVTHHHHFYFTNCGTTFNLSPGAMLEKMIDSTAAKEGFSARSHQLEIYGLCQNCSKN